MSTWKLPLRKIVISRWLEDVAIRLGESSDYIPNGLDFKTFGMDVRPEDRDANTIAMLYHHSDWKGSADGLKAIYEAKAKIPQLRVRLFGLPDRPPGSGGLGGVSPEPAARKTSRNLQLGSGLYFPKLGGRMASAAC